VPDVPTAQRGADERVPPFTVLDAAALEADFEQALARARAVVEAIPGAAPDYGRTVVALDRAEAELGEAAMLLEHLDETLGTSAYRDAYERVHGRHMAFVTAQAHSPALYRALSAVAASDGARALEPSRIRHLDRRLAAMRRAGAGLAGSQRDRLAVLDARLVALTRAFTQTIDDEIEAFALVVDDAGVAGLPEAARRAAAADARAHGQSGHRLTLKAHAIRAVLTYAEDRELRRTILLAKQGLGAGNLGTLREILALRAERARLLGHATFADLVTDGRVMGSRAAASSFVEGVLARLRPAFEAETRALAAFAQDRGLVALQAWDVEYFAEQQRRTASPLDPEALRVYFPVDRVLAGFGALLGALWGLELRPAPERPVWHDDVRVLDVFDPREGCVGHIYLDLFDRAGKRRGAWMSPILDRLAGPVGGAGPAVAVAACDLTPPVDGAALLSHAEVVRLFHELGHVCHHVLSRTPLHGQSGTRVAWDFVEVPGLLFENLAWEPDVLGRISGHVDTGAPLPAEDCAALVASRRHRDVSRLVWQLGIASADLALHGHAASLPPRAALEILQAAHGALDRAWPVPPPGGAAMVAGLTHLFGSTQGYEGSYYAYAFADVVAAQIVAALRVDGLVTRAAGDRLRALFTQGDARGPLEILRELVGTGPDAGPLVSRMVAQSAANGQGAGPR
jgi:oligopeptidase A